MGWLKHARYLGYLRYVAEILLLLSRPRGRPDLSDLAEGLSRVLLRAVDGATGGQASRAVDGERLVRAMGGLVDALEPVLPAASEKE